MLFTAIMSDPFDTINALEAKLFPPLETLFLAEFATFVEAVKRAVGMAICVALLIMGFLECVDGVVGRAWLF
jgi:hypothetical protein